MKQTAVEWFEEKVEQHLLTFGSIQPNVLSKFKQEAKEMEKEQKNKMPIHIHEGISNTWVYIEDGVVHVKPNDETYGGNK
jgi:leucyl aminopeptidase (aminopeptidase T)